MGLKVINHSPIIQPHRIRQKLWKNLGFRTACRRTRPSLPAKKETKTTHEVQLEDHNPIGKTGGITLPWVVPPPSKPVEMKV